MTTPTFKASVSKAVAVLSATLLLAANQTNKSVYAQNMMPLQLRSLVPDEQDLQGFVRVRPAGELADGWTPPVWSPQTHSFEEPISPAVAIDDDIEMATPAPIGMGAKEALSAPSGYSQIERVLYSQNGTYRLDIRLILNVPPTGPGLALSDLPLRQVFPSQAVPKKGTFNSSEAIGQESWVFPTTGSSRAMIFRAGQIMVFISGDISASAARHGTQATFPEAAIEAVAYQILLRAAQQVALTGVSTQTAHLAVNGHALPKNALLIAGQTYLPVAEFAHAMGLTSRWDNTTGALTLSGAGRKTVALTAGSTVSTISGVKAAALTVPVLKQAGQPVMTLNDLLAVTGGHITGHSGNDVQVKG